MKENKELVNLLNSLLADELASINQFTVHSEMCSNWGYNQLHTIIRRQALDDMRHAEWLIERIFFFNGLPVVPKLDALRICNTVPEIIISNTKDALNAVKSYSNAIRFAHELDDQGTVGLLIKICKMEEVHAVWAEKQLAQIEKAGLENYLALQSKSILNVSE